MPVRGAHSRMPPPGTCVGVCIGVAGGALRVVTGAASLRSGACLALCVTVYVTLCIALGGCATGESSPTPPEPELVITTAEVPATPAGVWLGRAMAIGNRDEPLPEVEDMPEVFAPVVLERKTWAEARAALEFLLTTGPYTLLGFVSEPEDHQIQALVERRSGRALVELVVEPTGAHRIQRIMVTPVRSGGR